MFYILILAVIVFDQLSKYYIQTNMDLNNSIPVIEGFFSITYIQNTGAAFSLLQGKTVVLILIQFFVILAIVVYVFLKKNPLHWTLLVSLAFIIGGGAGNLIDRISHGYVVDFLHFHFWPIFNIADISVCIGCGLLIIYVFFIEGKGKNGKQI
ncbi:MAG: signal peptidase II [Peptostreptococcaceae bacterium]|nr:signal peptidase II [Peptostreptococcaceae bacterium]